MTFNGIYTDDINSSNICDDHIGRIVSKTHKSQGNLQSLSDVALTIKSSLYGISKTLSRDNIADTNELCLSPMIQDIEMGNLTPNSNNSSDDSNENISLSENQEESSYETHSDQQIIHSDGKIKNKKLWRRIIKEAIHYYTHFLMFIIFEILFYFNYVAEYEKTMVFKMAESMKNNIINYLNIDVTQYNNCEYYNQVCTNLVDNHTNKSNSEIYDKALYLIFGMSGFLVILIIIETNMFTQKSSFPKEFGKSLMLMIFVGLFDYLFFNFFILKYQIVDTGELMCYLYEHDNHNGCSTNTTMRIR